MGEDLGRYDVIIVGAGPAGLSAALVLARARRRVLVCDNGRPRNAGSRGLHGFLTRDGVTPEELRALGREETLRYGVEWRHDEVTAVRQDPEGFVVDVVDGAGERLAGRRLLIATGVQDRLPELAGLDRFYGRSVHHCPYCDGWEWRDRALAVYGRGRAGAELALSLRTWSHDVVLLTDGRARLLDSLRGELERQQVVIRQERVIGLEGEGDRLQRILLKSGDSLPRDALFLATGNRQASRLAEDLGCRLIDKGSVWTNRTQRTSIQGVYAAGDVSRDVQFAIVAAAEGAKAAVAIHCELVEEEQRRKSPPAETAAEPQADGIHLDV
jgi:thioredoxin reductase